MNTTILFNVDKKVKAAAMKKATKQGLTLTAVLNMSLRAYVDDDVIDVALARDIAKARKQVREGKFVTEAELRKQLGI